MLCGKDQAVIAQVERKLLAEELPTRSPRIQNARNLVDEDAVHCCYPYVDILVCWKRTGICKLPKLPGRANNVQLRSCPLPAPLITDSVRS